MTLPVRCRGRLKLTVSAAAAALLAATMQAGAQQPPSSASTPAGAPASSAATPAAQKKAPAKSGATQATQSPKNARSYSLGLMWGEQLRNTGVTPDAINTARVAQGIQDAISGKAAVSDEDRQNIRALATSAGDANHQVASKFLAENGKKPGIVTTASGLEYQELKAGSGDSPKMGDSVVVNYRGTLLDGKEFDSSYKRGQPATFEVGRVIPGWNEALQLMKPGAKWKLYVPPQLAYDLRPPPGSGIAPGSMLLFEVELVSVKPAAPGATPPASANPAPQAKPAASVPASALPKPTGTAPINPPNGPNSPSPATIQPAPK
ncbi:MAG TPA: FKBP-type peptidyl-prolyl cis-trans isomerase [Steroidobacteraceae bacterium]|nr:FKBP-type peptidyl-prolyl cis-trans isomerase [Steroidobacteraceae bacterium]